MGDLKLQLVFLDVIPDFWEGNEIIRQEVNRFVKGFLVSLCCKDTTLASLAYITPL